MIRKAGRKQNLCKNQGAKNIKLNHINWIIKAPGGGRPLLQRGHCADRWRTQRDVAVPLVAFQVGSVGCSMVQLYCYWVFSRDSGVRSSFTRFQGSEGYRLGSGAHTEQLMGSKNCEKIVEIVKRHGRTVKLLGISPEFSS